MSRPHIPMTSLRRHEIFRCAKYRDLSYRLVSETQNDHLANVKIAGLAAGPDSAKPSSMNATDRITIEPGKRSGKPCIRGLRITVDDVLSNLAAGMSEAEILADFPDLEHEDFLAVFAFAADRERRLLVNSAA